MAFINPGNEEVADKCIRLRESACHINFRYLYNNVDYDLCYWIIVGGTPALAFSDYSFPQRYPAVEMYAENKWMSGAVGEGKYVHQQRVKGGIDLPPNPELELPNGVADIDAFLQKNIPRKELRMKRIVGVGGEGRIVKKVKIKYDGLSRVEMTVRIAWSVPTVTGAAFYYRDRNASVFGRIRDDCGYLDQLPEAWRTAITTINPIADATRDWENLSEEEYIIIRDALLPLRSRT